MKVLSFLLVGLSGFVQRAGSKHAFSSSKTPKRLTQLLSKQKEDENSESREKLKQSERRLNMR